MANQQNKPEILGLAAHVRRCWSEAYLAKESGVRPRLDAAMYARQGTYSPQKLQEIKSTGQPDIYVRVTATKCRIASGWLKDIYLGDTQNPWTLEATPIPDLPLQVEGLADMLIDQQLRQQIEMGMTPNPIEQMLQFGELKDKLANLVKEEADARAQRAQLKIQDQLQEGNFDLEFPKFIDDFVLFPAAILKGPIIRKRPTRVYETDPATGRKVMAVRDEFVYDVERVSPYDAYPSPNATSIQDGYFIEHMRMEPHMLEGFQDVPGYNKAAIQEVLNNPGGFRNWTFDAISSAKAEAEGRTTALSSTAEGLLDIIEFHGWVGGKLLREWGATWVEEDSKQYNVCVWQCGHLVLKAQKNYNPLGLRPYYKASFEDIPGAFWGNGLHELTEDPQMVCNAAIRALGANMAMSSGPQVVVDTAHLAPGEVITTMTPWRVWKMKSTGMQGQNRLIDFFQPQSNANELLAVFQKFYDLADDVASIPRYMGGASTTASRTSSGLAMLMDAGGKALKQAAMNIDVGVLSGLIEQYYDLNQQYDPDPDSQGDLRIVARGAGRLMQKAQIAMRRNEFMAATANQFDMSIMQPEGRAYLLREQAESLEMNPDKLVPAVNGLLAQQQMQAMMQGGGMGTPPAPQEGQVLEDGTPVTNLFPN